MGSSEASDDQDSADKRRLELLLTVYKAAVDEYRFNVNLNWERTKFFLTLISTLIAIGVGLLRVATDSAVTSGFLVFYFSLLIAISSLAIALLEKGKEYTQEAVYTKTLVERELGLLKRLQDFEEFEATLSIAPTRGMRDIFAVLQRKKLQGSPEHPFINPGSIIARIRHVIMFMIFIEAIGIIAAWTSFMLLIIGSWPKVG